MKPHIKSIVAVLIIIGILVFIFVFNPFKKENLPELREGIDYNLLIVTLDTTRADSLGCYGAPHDATPNIDSLASQGTLFNNCYASVPITLPSHSSIFTGKQPVAHGVRANGKYILNPEEVTLAELFKQKGYTTSAVVASFVLSAKFGLDQGFDRYDDSFDYQTEFKTGANHIPADSVYLKFKDWFKDNHSKKFFSWLHFYDPHAPYTPPGEYMEKFKSNPYIGEIAYMDHYIGKIIADLKEKQILDRTIVVIAGDHGEAFGEHEEYGHTLFGYEENLKTPLIFYHPGVFPEGKQVAQRVQLVDIMPTLLQLFKQEAPPAIQGTSLLSMMTTTEPLPVNSDSIVYFESMHGKEFMNWAPLTGIIFKQYKYISLPKAELYDLDKDPRETNNLFLQKQNQLSKQMDKMLGDYILSNTGTGGSGQRELTAADRQKLKSLGYISSFSGKKDGVIDPKEGVVYFNRISTANGLITSGDLDGAEKVLMQLMADKPDLTMVQLCDALYSLYRKKDDFAKMEFYLKKAISDFPELNDYRLHLARLYLDNDKTDAAEALCNGVLKRDPLSSHANIILGKLYYQRKDATRTLSYFERALELEPRNQKVRLEYASTLLAVGKTVEARKIVDELLGNEPFMQSPETTDMKIGIGAILMQLNELDEVISLNRRILTVNDKSTEAWNQLGMAYFRKRNLQEAINAYKSALDLDSENPLTLSNMGTFYLTLFRAKKEKEYHQWAVEHYSRAVEADPKTVSALNGLAVAYSFSGDQNKAITYWTKALEQNPDFSNIYFNLGITYLKSGQKKQALKFLRQCKDRLYSQLSSGEQTQLDNLISEASR